MDETSVPHTAHFIAVQLITVHGWCQSPFYIEITSLVRYEEWITPSLAHAYSTQCKHALSNSSTVSQVHILYALFWIQINTQTHSASCSLSLSVCRARRWTQCLCVWPVRLFPSCCPGRSRPQCAQPVSLPSGPRPASGCSVRSSPPAHPSAGQSQKTATKHKNTTSLSQ